MATYQEMMASKAKDKALNNAKALYARLNAALAAYKVHDDSSKLEHEISYACQEYLATRTTP